MVLSYFGNNVLCSGSSVIIMIIIMMIIMIMMDGSCIAQILPSRKLSALAHTIHANMHTDINILYLSLHTHTHAWSA